MHIIYPDQTNLAIEATYILTCLTEESDEFDIKQPTFLWLQTLLLKRGFWTYT